MCIISYTKTLKGVIMKIKIAFLTLALSLCAICLIPNLSYGIDYGEQTNSIINALRNHTDYSSTDKVAVNNSFPSKFDLRHCDLDGNGQYKNYVTSVKQQNPWGNCWAHGGIAAAETSILSKTRTDSVKDNQDSLNLSEHHLSWFNYTPMDASETSTQIGEGAYCFREEEAKAKGIPFWQSRRLNAGGIGMSLTSAFSRGDGPVKEPDWNKPDLTEKEKQLQYRSKNGTLGTDDRGFTIYSPDDDWSIDIDQRSKQDYELDNAYMLPDAATFKGEEYDMEHAEYVTGLMKDQLMQGRGVFMTYNCDNYTKDQEGKMKPRYINVDTWCQYAYKPDFPSHCVCIVGWDDTISRDKFLKTLPDVEKDDLRPPKDGAWIVKNSWGAGDSIAQGISYEPWGINDSGYFYLSYYDQSLVDEAAFDFNVNTPAKNKITHQLNYMSSEKLHGIEQSSPVTTANIFQAEQDEDLCELSGITNVENVDVDYKVYLLDSKDQQIDTGKLLCSTHIKPTYKGFHRVKLDQTYRLNKGQYFAVTTTQNHNGTYLMQCWYDCNHDGYDHKMTIDDYFCKAIVNPGESYFYTASDGKWTDFAEVKRQLEASEEGKYYTYDNFPIKAYATPAQVEPQPKVDPEPQLLAPTGDMNYMFMAMLIGTCLCTFTILKKTH